MTLQPYSVTRNRLAVCGAEGEPGCTDLGQMQIFSKYKQATRPPPISLCWDCMHDASRNVNSCNSSMLLLMHLDATSKHEHFLVNMQLDPSKNPIHMPLAHMGPHYSKMLLFVCWSSRSNTIHPNKPKNKTCLLVHVHHHINTDCNAHQSQCLLVWWGLSLAGRCMTDLYSDVVCIRPVH